MIWWVALGAWTVLSFPAGVLVGKRLKRCEESLHRLPPRSHL